MILDRDKTIAVDFFQWQAKQKGKGADIDAGFDEWERTDEAKQVLNLSRYAISGISSPASAISIYTEGPFQQDHINMFDGKRFEAFEIMSAVKTKEQVDELIYFLQTIRYCLPNK